MQRRFDKARGFPESVPLGTVVFHAGMGKAGSSSIQAWLARDLPALRGRGIELLTARREPEDHRFVRLLPYRRGRIHANRLVVHYEVEGADRRALIANFVEQLAAHAARRPVTAITVEAAELLFWRGDAELVDALNDLGGEHTVRVAYYVRPQHTALEARWRQWGFRSGQPPSHALRERADALDYLSTYESVTSRAEGFSFEVRPFRPDLLTGGDPVTDFAQTFLGLDPGDLPEQPPWSNRGLPIEVVNALAHAPEGLFCPRGSSDRRRAAARGPRRAVALPCVGRRAAGVLLGAGGRHRASARGGGRQRRFSWHHGRRLHVQRTGRALVARPRPSLRHAVRSRPNRTAPTGPPAPGRRRAPS